MQLMLILFLAAVVVGLALLFFPRSNSSQRAGKRTSHKIRSSSQQSVHPFQAVSISCATGACVPADEIAGERYLVNDAPILPLTGCSASNCNCKYIRYDDRRDRTLNRRISMGEESGVYSAQGLRERREKRGRRKSDWAFA